MVVVGRVNVNEEKIKVIAESVKTFGQTVAQEVRVRIRKEQETPEIFERLKQTFADFHGQTVVYLQLLDQKRLIKTDAGYWITPSPGAINKIENILGPGSVFLA